MSKLKQVLKNNGINPRGLDLLLGSGREAIHGLVADGASAIELSRRLRLAAGEIGYWPLIMGSDDDLDRHGGSLLSSLECERGSSRDLISLAARIDVPRWLAERAPDRGDLPAAGHWPAGEHANHHFTLPTDIVTGKPLQRVHIGLVPTVIEWQVPAFLHFGGWNDCPAPEYHVAMLKYWRHEYGAEVVGMSADTLELAVSRPPRDRAAALLGGSAWFFWWD
ncbi:MAG TPA: DUF4253 domain-containing protein [Tepidisphaeraceae bacterium]|nr:DUF4253 domain-containing protein [Tepidisphaeraceae bacterium]